MPLFEYKSECGKLINVYYSVKKKGPPQKIKRSGVIYHRVWSVPFVGLDFGKPKTVGDLAIKNTERMVANGDPRVLPKSKQKRPFWRDSDKPMKELNKLTPKQKANYIKTGKING